MITKQGLNALLFLTMGSVGASLYSLLRDYCSGKEIRFKRWIISSGFGLVVVLVLWYSGVWVLGWGT